MTKEDKGKAMDEVFGSAMAEAYKHKDKDSSKAKELVNKMYKLIPDSTDYERLPVEKIERYIESKNNASMTNAIKSILNGKSMEEIDHALVSWWVLRFRFIDALSKGVNISDLFEGTVNNIGKIISSSTQPNTDQKNR